MARPSLADSLRASLSRGAHVETAEKIARGFTPVEDVEVAPVSVEVRPVVVDEVPPASTGHNGKQPAKLETKQPAKAKGKHQAKQTDNQQAYKPADYPDKYPVIYSVSHEVKPANLQAKPTNPVNEPANIATNNPANEPVITPASEPAIYPASKPANYLASIQTKAIDPELWYPYTENQGKVLLYLIQAGGRTKRDQIANDTGVNIATVKYTLRVLVKDGYISPTVLDVNHKMRGFAYSLNLHLCTEYAGRILGSDFRGINQAANYPVNKPVGYPVVRPVNNPANEPGRSFSSSGFLDQTLTTTKPPGAEILAGPECGYWEEAGLQERQAAKWCSDFEVSASEMRQQLAWARWDLVVNGKESEITKDVISWFFGCLRKTAGCYPRPDNYQSPAEVRAAAIKLQLEKDREAQNILLRAESESEFQTILSNPQGEAYQELYAQASTFSKEEGAFALELELRRIFFKSDE